MKKLETYLAIYRDENIFCNLKSPSIMWFIHKLFFRGTLYNDRFNIFPKEEYEYNTISLTDNVKEIYDTKNYTLEELCFQRVEEILKYIHSLGKEDVYVSWSGGIDSTLIICSFLLYDKFKHENLHILYNKNSQEEYPYLLPLLEKRGVHIHNFYGDVHLYEQIASDNIVINGHGGDYIYPQNLFGVQYDFNNWKDSIVYFSEKLNCHNKDKYISLLEEYIKYFNLEVKSFSELGYLLCFNMLWHRNILLKKILSNYPKRRISFYNTLSFQKHALSRFYNIRMGYCKDGLHYKTGMKKIILKYTKDKDYLLHKGKIAANIFYSKQSVKDTILCIKDEDGYIRKNISLKYIIDTYFKEEYKDYFDIKLLGEKI